MYSVTAHSEPGGHLINEDAFAIDADAERVICALADGQGGQPGGKRAARLACDALMGLTKQATTRQLVDPRTWVGLLRRADEVIANDREAGFTTLIGLCVSDNGFCGASNGDSAAFLLSAGGRNEELTANQAKNPPVGSGVAACKSFEAKAVSPWKVLVMSDGVWKCVGRERMRLITEKKQGQGIVDGLLREARLRVSGKLQDDFTLIVVEHVAKSSASGEE